MVYLQGKKLITNKQFGFLKGKSTTSQLLTVINDWVAYLDKGGDIDVVYTDFKKAFDSVPHKRLLLKLARCGFSGQVLN